MRGCLLTTSFFLKMDVMPSQENDFTNEDAIETNEGGAEIANVTHSFGVISLDSDDEAYIDDEDSASDEDASLDESYSSSDPIEQTQIVPTQTAMDEDGNDDDDEIEIIQLTQAAPVSGEPRVQEAVENVAPGASLTTSDPEIRSIAAKMGWSPEEVIQRLTRNNGEQQPSETTPTRTRSEHHSSNRRKPYSGKKRGRPRAIPKGQQKITPFLTGGNEECETNSSGDNDIIFVSDGPTQTQRTLDRPPVPHTIEELYTVWENTAKRLLEKNTSPYSNFIHAFGDDTNEGVASRRHEMIQICKILFDFKKEKGKPGQPAILKGREREGKTVALFSITLAALLLEMRVVILCAPNKVAPVVDMVKKLERAGFPQMFATRHTLGVKATSEHGLQQCEVGNIFVAALGTIGDLKKVKSYINGQKKDGNFTVTLLDECDELTQGKGQQSMHIEDRNDPSSYQTYIPLDSRGEDDMDAPLPMSQQDAARAKKRIEKLATACAFFGKEIKPMTQLFACSATLSGCILNPIGLFDNNEITRCFKVYPKPGFTGIERYSIPEGCELEADGNMSLNSFQESGAVKKMLQNFFDRKNECDGTQFLPIDHTRAKPVNLRGMLFVSVSNRVNGTGGVEDFVKAINNMSNSMYENKYKNSTLCICCVGNPLVFFAGKSVKVASGTSFEDIYNKTAHLARQGKFPGIRLEKNIPFSSVCKHTILIGYNLTRRAMTAAFTPADEPNVLCKLQYLIFTGSKSITIDAVSQRITRASHDFIQHIVPNNYSVDVCMQPRLLDLLKVYRKMEDDMIEMQRRELNKHAIFRQKILVDRDKLLGIKISKRGIEVTGLSETGKASHDREQMNAEINESMRPYLDGYREYLEQFQFGEPLRNYAPDSVQSYFQVVRKYFRECDTIQDVAIKCKGIVSEYGKTSDGAAIPTEHHNALQSSKRFLEYYHKDICEDGASAGAAEVSMLE